MSARSLVTYRVADKDALAAVAGWIIDHKGGPWSTVDRRLRQLQPTLSRLRRKQVETIRADTVLELNDRLTGAKQSELADRLYAGIMSPELQNRLIDYLAWAQSKIGWRHVSSNGSSSGLLNYVGVHRGYDDEASRAKEMAELYAFIQSDIDSVDDIELLITKMRHRLVATVFADDQCRAWGHAFANRAMKKGHAPTRIELAIARVVEPLLDWYWSGEVERGFNDLSTSELRRFVKAGLDRETILLNRPSERDRCADSVFLNERDAVLTTSRGE